MGFLGDNISVSANNVTGQGDPNGQMDSLTFLNDLMNGGVINGPLYISGTLNVIGINPDDGEPYKLIGDISEMHDIQFPWRHVTTENSQVVDYEYVITENVGIGTSMPQYPLEVDGVSSINVAIIPSMDVTGAFDPYGDDLLVRAQDNIAVSVNLSSSESGLLFSLNKLNFYNQVLGLNDIDSNYL